MNDSVKDSVRQYIVTELIPGESPSNVKDDTPLIQSGILDSISVLKLVTFLENSYAFQVEAFEVSPDNLGNLERISKFVSQKRK